MHKCLNLMFADSKKKREYNRVLFKSIAARYNSATMLLSFNRDYLWKNFLVASLPVSEPGCIVDIACGTGDITSLLRSRFINSLIVGTDLTPEMLKLAKNRIITGKTFFSLQDMGMAAMVSESVNFVTGGYALRNSSDLSDTLSEIHRILKPGGTAAFLDFSKSQFLPLQYAQNILLQLWGALWGILLHGNPQVFMYIARSLRYYPDRFQLHQKMEGHGFEVLQSKLFMWGLIEILLVRKKN